MEGSLRVHVPACGVACRAPGHVLNATKEKTKSEQAKACNASRCKKGQSANSQKKVNIDLWLH